jgi:hypothetical protein
MKNRRLGALLFLWASVTGGMLALTACYGENCTGTSGGYGTKPGEGRMIDENTWESTPQNAKWLHFSSGHAWFFEVPALGDRIPYRIETYVTPVEEPFPTEPGKVPNNAALAAGNLAELSGIGPNRFIVRNGTCAEYFVRVVVQVPPRPEAIAPGTPGDVDASVEASVDAGADASDAGVDSGDDAGASDAATD